MPDKPAEPAVAPPRSRKLLLVLGLAVLILALAAGGAWYYVSKQRAAMEAGEEETVTRLEPKDPPTYFPMDSLVVNLADPGGEKVAQVGITLELSDSHATDKVKQYLPTIRSSILLLVSQRTAQELLQREGKEKLALDILREASRPFSGAAEVRAVEGAKKPGSAQPAKAEKKDTAHDEAPIRRVLFSSFIVQ